MLLICICRVIGAQDGNTPLHYAVEKGSIACVRLLMLNNADPTLLNTVRVC